MVAETRGGHSPIPFIQHPLIATPAPHMNLDTSHTFAQTQDREDPLASFRNGFHIPQFKGGDCIYLCGNSLGLQPKSVVTAIENELDTWKSMGVEGHFKGSFPWFHYHKFLKPTLVELTGALDQTEVTPMGSLSANLHFMLATFYQPDQHRYKIIVEAGAFPSDLYALETQCLFHGYDPNTAIIEVSPKPGAHILETTDIVNCIEKHADQLAMVLFSGVQYYSGQRFEIGPITEAGHQAGAMVGWDLAHAIGNVPLSLHQDEVDFAVWCSYKYLNSGPGGTAGIFVHQKHGGNTKLKRLGGWWGHHEQERFHMKKGFKPITGADGWQLSNANVLSMAAQKASLEIFKQANIDRIRKKSLLLTGYLETLLMKLSSESGVFEIITPENPEQRGAQLSLLFHQQGREVFQGLKEQGVIVDWREPGSIRVAPAPLYNTFEDVFQFCEILKRLIE